MTQWTRGDTTRGGRRMALAVAIVTALGASVAAQLASRPADEWRKVLDSPERVAALRVDEVIARLKLKPTDLVADIGAGTGPFVAPFAKAVPSGSVYAVEVDAGFFPLITEKTRAAGATNVHTVLGVFTDPQLPVSVDLAFMHDVFHHIGDRAGYVRTLVRYLKPNARVAIIDFNPAQSPHQGQPAMQVSKDQARVVLAEAGLTPIEDIPLFEEKWFVVFRRSN